MSRCPTCGTRAFEPGEPADTSDTIARLERAVIETGLSKWTADTSGALSEKCATHEAWHAACAALAAARSKG